MKTLTPPNLTRHITTTSTTTTATFTLLPKLPSTPSLNSHFYPRLNLHRPSHTTLRTKSFSPTAALNDAVFPSPNFPSFSSLSSQFISLSSSSSSSSSSPTSQPSDDGLFTWHRSSPTAAKSVGSPTAQGSDTAAVVLGWLGATQRHLRRYAEMYTSRGMDAVTFVVPVKDALMFEIGRKVENRIDMLAAEIVKWLVDNGGRQRSLVFHTFSTTGWLVYGSILAHLQERQGLVERIKGCIVDSGGDPELNPKVWAGGFTAALVKKRNTGVSSSAEAIVTNSDKTKLKSQDEDRDLIEVALFFVLEKMFTVIFKLPDVNQKLSRIISLLSENQPPCPQLYLYSTADKVIRYRTVESFIEGQKMKGRNVISHNFETSPHVDHYRTIPHVYSSLVNNFVNDILAMGTPV